MSQIIIALATLIIGAVMVTYGVYTSFEASKRTQFTSLTNGVFQRAYGHVDSMRSSLGRLPATAEVDNRFFDANDREEIIFRYHRNGPGTMAYICARSRAAPTASVNQAFDRVKEHWPRAIRGDACFSSGGPTASLSSVSLEIPR